MMSRTSWIPGLLAALSVLGATPALADCKDKVKEVREDIDKNKNNYSAEARAEAQKHLVNAEVPPAEQRRSDIARAVPSGEARARGRPPPPDVELQ
jgi:hypothetical protein